MSIALSRRVSAETLGTLMLVGCVVGSGILADQLSSDDGVALLANTVATGAILAVLILALGSVSGAHFNPAVTLVMTLRGELRPLAAASYMAGQLAGGLLGAMLAHAMFERSLLELSTKTRAGFGNILSEAVATFALVFTILAVRRVRPEAVAYAVALVIVAGYWWTASTSFANPAVALARTFTNTFAGIRMDDLPGFVGAELVGAISASAVFVVVFAHRARNGTHRSGSNPSPTPCSCARPDAD